MTLSLSLRHDLSETSRTGDARAAHIRALSRVNPSTGYIPAGRSMTRLWPLTPQVPQAESGTANFLPTRDSFLYQLQPTNTNTTTYSNLLLSLQARIEAERDQAGILLATSSNKRKETSAQLPPLSSFHLPIMTTAPIDSVPAPAPVNGAAALEKKMGEYRALLL